MEGMERGAEVVRIAAGPREAQREVLRWVEANRPASPEALWPPLRIVVPSRSLRRHLLAVLAREVGALAGVVVQTHRALAREVLERAGETPPPGGSEVQEVLVRRLAAEEGALRDALGDLEDGYAPVAAAVRDLLDAGFDVASAEAAADAVREAMAGRRAQRCQAVLKTARGWLERVERDGLAGRSALVVRATGLLAGGDQHVLPAHGILIHGFAEATGLVSDLLEVLVHRHGAKAILDLPPDPARLAERDAGWRFVERLGDRLGGVGAVARLADRPPEVQAAPLQLFVAPARDAELREVASRIRTVLEAGAPPESIGVVARRLDEPVVAAARRQLGRLGIPFSGEGASVPAGAARRSAAALAELLTGGAQAAAAVWLEAADPASVPGGPRLAGLVLRTAGAPSVAAAASLDVGALCPGGRSLELPVVEGVEERDGEVRRKRRRVEREVVARTVEAAGRLQRVLEERPERGRASDFVRWVRRVAAALGLSEHGGGPLADVLEILAALEPAGELSWDALAPVLARGLVRHATFPAGGAGGGVAVLGVTEARSRTFEHLFVVGLERGVFPFRRPEDPLLPEPARETLAVLLPEIPLARRSALEERYLFAQLLASARHVTLSWARTGADGRETNPSAFLERLALEGRLPAPLRGEGTPEVCDVLDPERRDRPRPELEHLVSAGLDGGREGVSGMLRALRGGAGAHAARVLDVLDPPRRPGPELGPLDGQVGPPPPGEIWVTRLEAIARCPFRAFLERELGLEPPPEVVAGAGRLDGALLGSVVHEALEEMAAAAGVPDRRRLREIEDGEVRTLPWPPPGDLLELTERAARRVAAREGQPAMARALARRAVGFLERVREADWKEGPPAVLGVEVRGAVEVTAGGDTVTVRFRADRVDRDGSGRLVLTDYKTGTVDNAVKTDTLIRYVRQGKLLQGGVYALGRPGALGRYLILKEEVKDGRRQVKIDAAEAAGAIRTAVGLAVEEVLSCVASGTLFPRLDGSRSPCDFCSVRLACLQDDSSYSRRLVAAVEALEEDHPVRRLWGQPKAKMPTGAS